MQSYYNTNRESGRTLLASEANAITQEAIILAFFESNDAGLFSPCDVQKEVLSTCPLTSVRRAMTNLSSEGLLEKTKMMKIGIYGKQVHTWRLVKRKEWRQGDLFS